MEICAEKNLVKKMEGGTRVQGFVKKGKINWKDERKLSNLWRDWLDAK